jgi:hypothetical protein
LRSLVKLEGGGMPANELYTYRVLKSYLRTE